MSKQRRVYGARVKDHGPNPKWGGDWHRIKTLTNPRGEWSTKKGAQQALDTALEQDESLTGHVFTYKVDAKPKTELIKVDDWLYGNVVSVMSVPGAYRTSYADTLRKAALAASRYGHRVYVSSSFRTLEEQRKAYALYLAGGPLAAKPGTSLHEKGLAIDVPNLRSNKALLKEFRKVGLIDDVPSEKWHASNRT